ncbi:MAG: hypothetical protein E7641_08810 [Ruminococcaceae bacterium]|nr:hypothetical protein [Oscillospiraceae bacterium]
MNKKQSAKYNTNYFVKGDTMKLIGMICLALLIPLYLFGSFIFYSYLMMCVAAPLGFVLFLVGSLGKTSDSDMDNIVAHRTLNVELDFDAHKRHERNLSKVIAPHSVEGYEYREGLLYKKAKSGVLRSNEYYKTNIYTFTNELAVVVRKVDLINETETTETLFFPFSDLSHLSVKTEKMSLMAQKKKFIIQVSHLSFMNGEDTLLTVPLHSDIIFEQYIEKLNEQIEKSRSSVE